MFGEKENIHSISEDGEPMLTIFASFALEKSQSISKNYKQYIEITKCIPSVKNVDIDDSYNTF